MGLLKLLALAAMILLAWVVWQRRHTFVRRSPQGATRTKLSRNYTVQRDFLKRVDKTELMKLVAFAYAISGIDPHHRFVYDEALRLDATIAGCIRSAFCKNFHQQPLGFQLENARDNGPHYQQMCNVMASDVRFLQIYLLYKDFFAMMLDRLTSDTNYYAYRNSDIIPSEDVLQLLWTEYLERP